MKTLLILIDTILHLRFNIVKNSKYIVSFILVLNVIIFVINSYGPYLIFTGAESCIKFNCGSCRSIRTNLQKKICFFWKIFKYFQDFFYLSKQFLPTFFFLQGSFYKAQFKMKPCRPSMNFRIKSF